MRFKSKLACAVLAVSSACVAPQAAQGVNPVLEVVQLPVPGMIFAVRLRDIAATPVAGWQAFLEYDPSRLTFISGAYITSNFGLPVLNPVTASGNNIDLACGIDPTLSQPPSNVNQDVAILVFSNVGTGCQPQVRVRIGTVPPTRLTNILGQDVIPLTTSSPWITCPADISGNGVVSVQDLFDFVAYWFALDCRADFNNFGGVSVQDIFDFLAAWFAGCP